MKQIYINALDKVYRLLAIHEKYNAYRYADRDPDFLRLLELKEYIQNRLVK